MKKKILNFSFLFFAAFLVYLVSYHFSFLAWVAVAPLIVIARGRSWLKVFWSALAVASIIGFLNSVYAIGWREGMVFWATFFFASFYFLFIILQRPLFAFLKPPFAVFVPPLVGTCLLFVYSFTPFGNFLFNYASRQPRLGPLASIGSEYGVMFLMFLFNSLLVFIFIQERKKAYLIALGGLSLVLISAYAFAFFSDIPGQRVRVAFIQGGFSESWEWRAENAEKLIFEKYESLTWEAVDRGVDLVIWPEYAIPRDITKETILRDRIAALAREAKINLILGAFVKQGFIDDQGRARKYDSAFVFNREGKEIGRYDAVRPFVLDDTTAPGNGYQSIETDVGRIGVLICYDEYFSEGYREYARQGVDFFVVIANNNPVGDVSGIHSLKRFSELKAAVNKKYVLRSTNNGITQAVNPYGFVIAELEPFRQGILYTDIFVE